MKEEQIITVALDDDTNIQYRDPDELSKYIQSRIVNESPWSDSRFFCMGLI